MLKHSDAPLAQSALLVIDVQESFRLGARWQRRSTPDFEPNVTALVEAYRAAGRPVFFILHTDGDEGFQPGHPAVRLMDFLAPRADEPVLLKETRNAFTTTPLHLRLMEAGVRRLAVTGISTEQCCETTTRVAADLGYAVDFVLDATMTFPIADPAVPGRELGVEAILERTRYVLQGRFARIVSARQLVGELAALPRRTGAAA